MNNNPMVSVITATFNSEHVIEKCIRSVGGQTYKNIEHIIIDGASLDDTLRIINRFEQAKMPIVFSEVDDGIYSALNKGIEAASGEIIGFLHSDDTFKSIEVIDHIVSRFLAEPTLAGVYGDLEYVDGSERVLRFWKSCDFEYRYLKRGWMPPHPTMFLKSDVYRRFGKFDEHYRIAGDYEFMLRIFAGGINAAYTNKTLVRMKIGGMSNRSMRNILMKTKEDFRALQPYVDCPVVTLLLKNLSKLKQFIGR